jgi:hypothetical protein
MLSYKYYICVVLCSAPLVGMGALGQQWPKHHKNIVKMRHFFTDKQFHHNALEGRVHVFAGGLEYAFLKCFKRVIDSKKQSNKKDSINAQVLEEAITSWKSTYVPSAEKQIAEHIAFERERIDWLEKRLISELSDFNNNLEQRYTLESATSARHWEYILKEGIFSGRIKHESGLEQKNKVISGVYEE